MPEPTPQTLSSANNNATQNRPLIDETVTAHLLQIFDNQNQQYVSMQAQVDKIIGLQEKGMDYIHNERMQFFLKQKIEFGVSIGGLVLMVALFVFSVYKIS